MGRRLVTIEMEQHAGGGAGGCPGPVAVDVPCGCGSTTEEVGNDSGRGELAASQGDEI